MKLFRGRPLCFGCAGAAAAAFFCAFAGVTAAIVTASASFVFAVLSLIFLKPRGGFDLRLYFTLLFALVCAVSLSSAVFFGGAEAYVTDEPVFVTGYADTSVRSGDSYKVKITSFGGRRVNVDMLAGFSDETPEPFGKFSAYATVSRLEGENRTYMNGKGVILCASLSRVSFAGTEKNVLYYVNALRDHISSRFYLSSDRGDLYSCLFLGRRDLCPDKTASDFRDLGVSHLLAVSGLHVAALLAGLELILTRAFGRRRYVFAVLAVSALFYAALAGFSGSVVRAALMYFIMRSGDFFKSKGDGITGLMLSVSIMTVACPYAVYDLGFILSASAAAGIILIGAPASRRMIRVSEGKTTVVKGLLYAAASFAVTLSALVFTLPAAAYGYGEVVFVSLIANLFISPFIIILLYACPYLILLSYIPPVGRVAGAFCDGIAELAERAASNLCTLPSLSVSVRYGFVKYLIAAFAAAFLIFVFSGVVKRAHYTALATAFLISFLTAALIFNADLAKKDVMIVQSSQRGDIAAVCSGGECTIYDLSGGASSYAISEKLLEYGFTEAGYVCAAPFTSYHVQSVPAICRTVRVKRLILPGSAGARFSAELCGAEAEYYDVIPGGGVSFVCGRVTVGVRYEEKNGRAYAEAVFGKTAFDEIKNNTEFDGDIAVIELK